MGQLNPGATYVYERADDVIYAREAGSDPSTRFEIGRDHDPKAKSVREAVLEDKMWGDIRRAARINPTLQSALDECIMIYKLSKDYNNGL